MSDLPLAKVYSDRQAAQEESLWQSLIGGVKAGATSLVDTAKEAGKNIGANPGAHPGQAVLGVMQAISALPAAAGAAVQDAFRRYAPETEGDVAIRGGAGSLVSHIRTGLGAPDLLLNPETAAADPRAVQAGLDADMTYGELANIVTQFAGGPAVRGAVKGAKAVPGAVRAAGPALVSESGAIGRPPGPKPSGAKATPPGATGAPTGAEGAPNVGEARVNVGRIAGPDSVRQTIASVNALQASKDLAEHRKVVPNAQTARESVGALSIEDALALDPETAVLDRTQGLALRDHLRAAGGHLDEVLGRIREGDQGALGELPGAFVVAGKLAVADEAVARNTARGLQARAIESTETRAPFDPRQLGDLVDRLEGSPDMDPMTLADRLESLRTKEQKKTFVRQAVSGLEQGQSMLYEWWINGLLSGPQTHAANVLSNTGTALWAIPERWLAQNLHFGAEPGVVRGEATAMLRGLVEGTRDGFRVALDQVREESKLLRGQLPELTDTSGMTKIERPPAITAAGVGLDPDGIPGRMVDYAGALIRTPSRMLITEDGFFKSVNYRMELKAQALREARHEGRTGDDLFRRVADLEANPPASVKLAADQFALAQTFNKELTGLSGDIGGGALKFAEKVPMGRIVLPFVRTPTNIFQYMGQRTPILNAFSETLRKDIGAGGAAKDLALGKAAGGLAVSMIVAYYAASGLITGGGPKDPNLQRDMKAIGHQPYSVKLGDTYYSYNRLDGGPGALLGIVSDAAEIMGQLPAHEADQLAMTLGLAAAKNMASKSYLSGLADVLEALEKPDRGTKHVMMGWARSLVPAGIRQAERYLDPTIREARSYLDQIKAGIPGWSETLPPRRNLWGDPIRVPPGFGSDLISPIYQTNVVDDPVTAEIVRHRVSVAMPAKYIGGTIPPQEGMPQMTVESATVGVELTPGEYDRLVLLMAKEVADGSGKNLKDRLAQLIASPEYQKESNGPNGRKADLIKHVVGVYKDIASKTLLQQEPELARLVKEHQERRIAEMLRPDNPRAQQSPMPGLPGVDALLKSLGR